MIGGLSGSKFNDPFLTDRLGSARIHTQFVIIFANRVAVLALNIDYLNIQHLALKVKKLSSQSLQRVISHLEVFEKGGLASQLAAVSAIL